MPWQPHSFTVLHPAALQDPAVLRYVAAVLARRLDGANQVLVELKSDIQDKPRSVIDKTIKEMERLLGASGANLGLYSGYSYDSSVRLRKTCMISTPLMYEDWA